VEALKVGDLRLIARFDQGVEPRLDQLGNAAAKDRLLTEEVGLGLFLEGVGSLRPGWRRCPSRRRGRSPGRAPRHLVDGNEGGTPAPFSYSLRTRWPGPFGAIMTTSRWGAGTIWPKWMLKP